MDRISGTTIILRLEGAALAIACLWLYGGILHQSWWLFALLILTPDLSMLAYFAGPKIGAAIYNAVHSWVLVVALPAPSAASPPASDTGRDQVADESTTAFSGLMPDGEVPSPGPSNGQPTE